MVSNGTREGSVQRSRDGATGRVSPSSRGYSGGHSPVSSISWRQSSFRDWSFSASFLSRASFRASSARYISCFAARDWRDSSAREDEGRGLGFCFNSSLFSTFDEIVLAEIPQRGELLFFFPNLGKQERWLRNKDRTAWKASNDWASNVEGNRFVLLLDKNEQSLLILAMSCSFSAAIGKFGQICDVWSLVVHSSKVTVNFSESLLLLFQKEIR